MKTPSSSKDQDTKPRAAARQAEQGSRSNESDAIKVSEPSRQQNSIDTSPYMAAQRKRLAGMSGPAIQNKAPEEEELLQGKLAGQRKAPEEEELMQGKFTAQLQLEEEEELQGKFAAQRQSLEEEEEPMQGKHAAQRLVPEEAEDLMQGKFAAQRLAPDEEELMQGKFTAQMKSNENRTGLPDSVKSKMEKTFGTDFSDVKVHPNSNKAEKVGAMAYTQGTDVHFAPGQFKPESAAGQQLLGHELTHVIQQGQGKVKPNREVAGMPVNDSPALEKEADEMGKKVKS